MSALNFGQSLPGVLNSLKKKKQTNKKLSTASVEAMCSYCCLRTIKRSFQTLKHSRGEHRQKHEARERANLDTFLFSGCMKENIYVTLLPTLSWSLGTVCTGIGCHCNWGMMGAGRLAGGNIPARQAWALIRVRS